MSEIWDRITSTNWWVFLLLFAILVVLFTLTFLPIDITAILEEHGNSLATLGRVITGLASLASLGIAVWKYRRETKEQNVKSSGPARNLEIHSNEGVINLNLVVGSEGRIEDYPQGMNEDTNEDAETGEGDEEPEMEAN